jgi:hypothetical protein
MKRSYEIRHRPDALGRGWKLTLNEDGQEVGGGLFPVVEEDPKVVIDWWNAMTEERSAHWLMMAAVPMPAAARHAYLLSEAYNSAFDEGESWANP